VNTLGRRGIVIIGAVVGVVVLVAGWFLMVAPVRSDISKTKAATAAQTEQNDGLSLTLATMRSIAKKLPQEQAELAVLNKRVPDQVMIPSLLRAIQTAATATGVDLTSLVPGQPAALAGAPGISSVSITLAVTGGYAEVEQFDSSLEALQRTYLVSGFTLSGGGAAADSTTAATQATLSATLNGQVLVHTATATATAGK
jgi:Tfp pilus assembly protein PilO